MNHVIVVGAGPSGMMAAIAAARKGASVTILERMDKPGKKLLITGNGRCNLTNITPLAGDTFRGASPEFVHQILLQFSVGDTLRFFGELGLLTRERDGYIYPYTDQAGSVLEILLQEIRRLGIKLKTRELVTDIRQSDGRLLAVTETWSYPCDRIILCAGGKAAPQTGSDGSGYMLAGKCGHHVTPVYPALTALKTGGNLAPMLAGTRNYSALTLEIEGEKERKESGELQWTEYGVSGIVIFQLSRYAAAALAQQKYVRLHIDLMPEYSSEEILALLRKKDALSDGLSAADLLTGLLKKKTMDAFLKLLGKKPFAKGRERFYEDIIALIKDLTLNITGTKSFDMAQVCAGGVPEDEVNPVTLESRKLPGLYFAGELLDVDAVCGGYNLQWAWSSGYTAGTHAAQSLRC